MASKTNVSSTENQVLTLKQAVALSGLSMIYIRRAINEGKLPASKEQVGTTNVYRNIIKTPDFEAWRASRNAKTRREDGRNKFDLYATATEYEKLSALCKANGLELPIKRAHTPKPKAAVEEA